jgi:hypothetical protein
MLLLDPDDSLITSQMRHSPLLYQLLYHAPGYLADHNHPNISRPSGLSLSDRLL